MPSMTSASTGVFGRFTGKRQTHETNIVSGPPVSNGAAGIGVGNGGAGLAAGGESIPLPLDGGSESDTRSKLLNVHKRESSILSIGSSVADLGNNVRRSVSLRSHRTNPSQSSNGHKPRYPSSGNLLASPPWVAPLETPEPPQHQPPPPPRSRGKLSISARSFSSRFRSTDTLPIFNASEPDDSTTDRPLIPSIEPPKASFSMLVTPSAPKRPPPDRPSLPPQSSFTRDVSSSHGIPNGAPSISTTTTATSGSHNPSIIYQTIHETAAKRMATIDYLRKVHDGNIFYFSTLHYTPTSLHALPSLMPHKLGRRATGYLLLGYSLPSLLDLNSGTPLEYLKAFSALLQEFETYQSLVGFDGSGSSLSRARVGQMFKSGMGLGNRVAGKSRRSSASTDSIALDAQKANSLGIPGSAGSNESISPQDSLPSPINPSGHDFHHLLTPHLPFEPDFNTTFSTLCDTLVDAYGKLLHLVSGPDVCSAAVGEAFAKADKAVRKILVSNIMREFEDNTRAGIKGEVGGLAKLTLGGLT